MKNAPEDTFNCWIISSDEFKAIKKGAPFNPTYHVYNYFHEINRTDSGILEGWIGHRDAQEIYHDAIIQRFTYFEEYNDGRPVYMTIDKVSYYELDDIITSNPLRFIFRRLKKSQSSSVVEQSHTTKPHLTIQPLHFEDLLGKGFERLVFAYVDWVHKGAIVDWLGEPGGDQGRDIWVDGGMSSCCYQCANHKDMSFQKGKDDIDNLVLNGHKPDRLIMVCGGGISNSIRQKICNHAKASGFSNFELWSASKLEAKLYKDAPDLISRFFNGGTPINPALIDHPTVKQASEQLPVLEVLLEPKFAIQDTDEELAAFIEEAFYFLKKGKDSFMKVNFIGDEILNDSMTALKSEQQNAVIRKKIIGLRKTLDLLEELRDEIIKKIELLYHLDKYPVSEDYEALATSLREILLISITPDRLYEETDLTSYIEGEADYSDPAKIKGHTKIDIFGDMSGKIGCSIWLSKIELDKLISGRIRPEQLRDMWFFNFECSDLQQETLVYKVIPSFIDKMFEYKFVYKNLASDDNTSWIYLPSFTVALG